MKHIHRKLLCAVMAFTLIFSVSANSAEFTADITSLSFGESGNITMIVNKSAQDSAKGIIAVHDTNGILKKALISDEIQGSGEKTLIFNQSYVKDDNSIVKAFL